MLHLKPDQLFYLSSPHHRQMFASKWIAHRGKAVCIAAGQPPPLLRQGEL
jgi:hypothetical protein